MSRTPLLDAGDRTVDDQFFAAHHDARMYIRWATAAECEVQQVPVGIALIVMRRSPTDSQYLRIWCQPYPGRPLHETFAVFGQLPQVPPEDQHGAAT